MSFVDELRKADTRTLEQIAFDRYVKEIHQAIKERCMQFARQGSTHANGQIFRDNDPDSSNTYCAGDSPQRPRQRIEMSVQEQYAYSQRSRKERQASLEKAAQPPKRWAAVGYGVSSREMTVPELKQQWENIARAVRPLLQQDGFASISLDVVPLTHHYYEVREEGNLFNKRYYRALVETGTVYDYTIRFFVVW